MFVNASSGALVPISGTDPIRGEWTHQAFIPDPLPVESPALSPTTYLAIANARAALASLDSTAQRLPNPTLLRLPTLRREAQSTSALEGTYAPLADVLVADEDAPPTAELNEVLNYVRMATMGFARFERGEPLSIPLIGDLHRELMRKTALSASSGSIRDSQVVIGRRDGADPNDFPVRSARFVPAPPGFALETGIRDLVDWMRTDRSTTVDPIVAAALAHHQFETLHPFSDGNGRIGRYLIVVHLGMLGVLREPTLTVSPWFEARRPDYYDRLLSVSASGDWDPFVRFFADGLNDAATRTRDKMVELVDVQSTLKDIVRASTLRADSAQSLVDFAVANPSFTVRDVAAALDLSYVRANKLVAQLVDLSIVMPAGQDSYNRRFFAPRVIEVLVK